MLAPSPSLPAADSANPARPHGAHWLYGGFVAATGSDNSIPYASWASRYNSSDSEDSLIGDDMEDTKIA
eukprot:229901-Hanusia_phi.AAC.1